METILEVQGVLNQTLPEVFRDRLPALLTQYRNVPVHLLVTTQIDRLDKERERRRRFYLPGHGDRVARFTWKAAGPLHAVIRRFRLEFLRHLGPADRRCVIYLGIWLGEDAVAGPGAEMARPIQDDAPLPPRAVPVPLQSGVPPAGLAEEPAPHAPPALAPSALAFFPADPAEEPQPVASPPRPSAQIIDDAAPATALAPSSAPEPALSLALEPAPLRPAEPLRHAPQIGRGVIPLPGNFYQDWFGFERMPFNNTPDPRFFFPAGEHQEALSRLIYAISERKGFVLISGEIGSGKSTLCRTLLAQLPGDVKTALITHTHVDAEQLVHAIAEDLDLPVAGLNKYETLQRINDYLVAQLAAGATVCIIIDEAQHLSPAALEEVRMITNLETDQEKLVQLILLGQPELRDKILLPGMLQLRQRIAVQFHLLPLTRAETIAYIRHRLRIAGPSERLDFKRRAMAEVFVYSGGVPRLINSLCDNALLTAYTHESRTITPVIIRESARDLALQPLYGGWRAFFRMW
jgi:general secretion pathway protein A